MNEHKRRTRSRESRKKQLFLRVGITVLTLAVLIFGGMYYYVSTHPLKLKGDVVEQEIQLAGVRLLLADTAGIRDTDDLVEAEGIRRSYRHLERAGLVLAVFDGSAPLSPADLSLAEKCAGRPAVAILNKTDLPQQADEESLRPYFSTVVNISAKDAAFLPAVEQAVTDALHLAEADPDAGLLANERQLAAARTAQAALADALEAVNGGYTLDAAGVCVDDALRALYELTGENAGDDVIDEVFSRFCVGK